MRAPPEAKAAMKANPRNGNGSHSAWLPFPRITGRLTLESVLQPELDLPVSINCTNCGGDVHKVRVSYTVRIYATVGKQIRMVEKVEEFDSQGQRLPFHKLE